MSQARSFETLEFGGDYESGAGLPDGKLGSLSLRKVGQLRLQPGWKGVSVWESAQSGTGRLQGGQRSLCGNPGQVRSSVGLIRQSVRLSTLVLMVP